MTAPDPSKIVPIGQIHTRHTDPSTTPVQSSLNRSETGTVELYPEYAPGLLELDGFDEVWLLTWLGPNPGSAPVPMRQVPFLLTGARRPVGVFAMRGPRRPNPIGLHLVRLLELTDTGFRFGGVDMVNGTPVLDIKPWVAPLDVPPVDDPATIRNGWFDDVDLTRPHSPSSLASE
jgi:tRNA-Thr(GGU) m(6)t(6)A37 methyltransferase TsaA